ncbi:MAG: efflux RND transporter periplasmic adaptor subunit [Bryobacteraceae bacterium]
MRPLRLTGAKRLSLILLVPLALLLAWGLRREAEPPTVPFVKARRETLISMLPTNGKAEPIEWQAVRVDSPGLVVKVAVRQGQQVAKGAMIAQVGAPGLVEQLRGAQAREAQAQTELGTLDAGGRGAELAQIESQLNRAKFDRDQAQRDYGSLKRLSEKQAATPVEVEAAHAKLRQAEIEIESLARKRATLVSKADIATSRARLQETEASVRLAREKLAQGSLRAPMAGIVYDLPVRQGTYLNAGDLVSSVGILDRLRVRVYVDEPELGRVVVGQPVRITWDALPGREWHGTVEKKPVEVIPLGTRQVGEVLCTIDNADRELVPGTSVNAEIRTNVVENALTIPKETLRRESNALGVYVLRDGRVRWTPVKSGISSVTRAAISQGLRDDDSVALPTDVALKDGERVTPVYP